MSGRFLPPITGRIYAICAAATSLATWHVAPAFASATAAASCGEPQNTMLEIPVDQLHASSVSHEAEAAKSAGRPLSETDEDLAAARFLSAEAEAALREVVEDGSEVVAEPRPGEDPVEKSGTKPAIKARVPGVSEVDLARYKRHMYRRDI